MEKIVLADKEYELPEITFGIMRKLGKNGFHITDFAEVDEKIEDFLTACVATVANCTLDEADNILTKSVSNLESISNTFARWIINSDFFKQMRAKQEKK